ncbi:hypothetical protein ACK8GE_18905 [Micromonosporaceae bacterium DT194]|uniref:hypothetical protein n=1 Tax=Melissospora conviva TaxID=3388432 RepID=UPI003C202893
MAQRNSTGRGATRTATKNRPGNQTPGTPRVAESDISRLRVDELRGQLRDRGVRGTSGLRKPELVQTLVRTLRTEQRRGDQRRPSGRESSARTDRRTSAGRSRSETRSRSEARSRPESRSRTAESRSRTASRSPAESRSRAASRPRTESRAQVEKRAQAERARVEKRTQTERARVEKRAQTERARVEKRAQAEKRSQAQKRAQAQKRVQAEKRSQVEKRSQAQKASQSRAQTRKRAESRKAAPAARSTTSRGKAESRAPSTRAVSRAPSARAADRSPSARSASSRREGAREGGASSRSLRYAQTITSPHDRPERPGRSLVTTNHDVIQRWARERKAKPSTIAGTEHDGHAGVLTFDFPGYSGSRRLQHITWAQWFQAFDERELNLIYQETLRSGRQSNFFRTESPNREDG